MDILLSVKPRIAENIFTCRKFYEYRKCIWVFQNPRFIFVYSSNPVKKVLGFFKPGEIISGTPHDVWSKLKIINYNFFKELSFHEFAHYFRNSKKAYAIEICSPVRFKNPMSLFSGFNLEKPPQNFCYLNKIPYKPVFSHPKNFLKS